MLLQQALHRPGTCPSPGRATACPSTCIATGLPPNTRRIQGRQGATARWEGTSTQLAARAWRLTQRGIATRGTKVRPLWDLRWHGENQAVANPQLASILGVCPLCGHPHCSKTHILCNSVQVSPPKATA